jgi:uncharacterized membrane protein YcaP (DUF421 family)
MDLGRIMVRVIFGYLWALALVRVSGRRTISQSDVPSFVVALVLGDMFDDLFWAEVPVAQFVTGATALVMAHLWMTMTTASIGGRRWQRESAERQQ